MKEDTGKRDYQTYARIYASDPERAKAYRDEVLGNKEAEVDEQLEKIQTIVNDPAEALKTVYEKWVEDIKTIKDESTEVEKRAELRKLLKAEWVKVTNFMNLAKLTELAKEHKIIE